MNLKGLIALIIVLTLCILLLVSIIAVAIRGEPLSEGGLSLTRELTLALLSLAAYIIGQESEKRKRIRGINSPPFLWLYRNDVLISDVSAKVCSSNLYLLGSAVSLKCLQITGKGSFLALYKVGVQCSFRLRTP